MSSCLGDLKCISFTEITDCTKKYDEMCDLYRWGVFLNCLGYFDFSACGTTLLFSLYKSLSKDQSDCSISSRDHKFI